MSVTEKDILLNKETKKDSVLNEEIVLSNDDEETEEAPPPVAAPKQRSRIPIYVIGGIILVTVLASFGWWLYARQFVVTDDAFLEGNISSVSPKITARIAKIHVADNQAVQKGDLLVELESNEVLAKVAHAQTGLLTAQAVLAKAKANVVLVRTEGQAGLSQANSNLETAKNSIEQSRMSSFARQNGVEQARRRAEIAAANVRKMQAQIPAAEASIVQAQAQARAAKSRADVARLDHERDQALFQGGYVAKQNVDLSTRELSKAESDLTAATKQIEIAGAQLNSLRREVEVEAARVREAETGITAAENDYRQSLAQVNVFASQAGESAGRLTQAKTTPARVALEQSAVEIAEAQVAQAQAAVNEAEIELENTKIYAPQNGFVSQKSVQVGQLVQPDSSLMTVTQSGVWVIANYKETQIGRLQIGQPVDIYVDAYPSAVFRGHVDSFQAGTGSRFSVLPSENATGNFVKVVQRITVKIVFDKMPDDQKYLLVPGMSVVPKAHAR